MHSNPWCQILGIEPPRLEVVKDHREAKPYSLLLVALLERGEPMTLEQVAERFVEAGVANPSKALLSLRRCKPARAPVYRDGDLYALDPHDQELDLWAFRLDLRPPKFGPIETIQPDPAPLPSPQVPLSLQELVEAWTGASLNQWSASRLALAVLEAHGGGSMPAVDIIAFLRQRTRWFHLGEDPKKFERRNSAVRVLENGHWSIAPETDDTLVAIRKAVREQIRALRNRAVGDPVPGAVEERIREAEQRREARARKLSRMSRALLVGFPAEAPRALTILDVERRELTTYLDRDLETARERLADFDILGAVEIRPLLRTLGFQDPEKRLAELGPPQKTRKLGRSGRTLKVTTTLLVQASCGIRRPFGEPEKLAEYLETGDHAKLRRRLEADAKSLHALYQYGRLHGAVRLRWRSLDEFLPAPWVHHDEKRLYHQKETAFQLGVPLRVVAGSSPDWENPWSRSKLVEAKKDPSGRSIWLVDEFGFVVDDAEIQAARLAMRVH